MIEQRDLPRLAAFAATGYILVQLWPGLFTRFAPDDMQNLYTYWLPGPWHWVRAALQVATPEYRPLAAGFYLPLFQVFGFNPLPFRIAMFAILCANAWLLYSIAREVTASRETGALALILGGFHASATGAYLSTSTIYEALCFFFLGAALLLYTRVRRQGRPLSWTELAAFGLLYAAALDSKEMAVVLAPVLIVYELLFRPRRAPSMAELRPIALAGLMAAAVTAAKVFGARSITAFEAYRPVLSWSRYLDTSRAYVAEILLFAPPAAVWLTFAFWGALFLTAALLRNRAMLFGCSFALLSLLPVNFVTAREGFVLYIPLLGLGIWAGALVQTAFDALTRRLRLAPELRDQAAALLFAALIVGWPLVHRARATELAGALHGAQDVTARVLAEFVRVNPRLAPGGKVLYRDTPFADFDVYFIAKLHARDRNLQVAISGLWGPAIRGDRYEGFDQEYRFEGVTLYRIR